MASHCHLCNRKIGFFEARRSILDLLICKKCYKEYEKVLLATGTKSFQSELDVFKSLAFSENNTEIIVDYLSNLHIEKTESEEKISVDKTFTTTKHEQQCANTDKINSNIGPFDNQDLIYSIDGIWGRHLDVYVNKVVITIDPASVAVFSYNTPGVEKPIYYSDCTGVLFKQWESPHDYTQIGYIKLETISSSLDHENNNIFSNNSFPFDTTVVSNERMVEVSKYIISRVDAAKKVENASIPANNNTSFADELLKLKQFA